MNGKSTNKAFDSQLIDLALINETVIYKEKLLYKYCYMVYEVIGNFKPKNN